MYFRWDNLGYAYSVFLISQKKIGTFHDEHVNYVYEK